jgi:hypothetical protein
MKKLFILFISLIALSRVAIAANIPDEGMWLPMFIDRLNYVDMQKMGLKLTAKEIYDINNSSLKDAIVIFGGGCTGEMISAEGLLLTNHHCGYGSIQNHSSVDHDYLRDGYWAKTREMELPNPNLTVRFLIRMEDVTTTVNSTINDKMPEKDRNTKIKSVMDSLQKDAVKGTSNIAVVRSFFDGNEFYMFVYEVYKDVRFVGAPPSAIGKFGADTDNWMWPRHTGDFSMFRVYMSPDGKPAEYNKDNVAYKPKKFLNVSLKGVKEGDYAMIMGYPGSTQRYMTSYGVKMALDIADPATVKIRTTKLQIMKEDMDKSDAVRIQYASKYAGTANYWKFFQGEIRGLKRLDVVNQKKQLEDQFTKWFASDNTRMAKYGSALTDIGDAYTTLTKYNTVVTYTNEALFRGPEIVAFTFKFEALYNLLKAEKPEQAKIDEAVKSLKESIDPYFKDYNQITDQKLLAALLKMFYEDVPKDQQPAYLQTVYEKNKGDFAKYAELIFSKSIFASKDKINAFLNAPKLKVLDKDPAYQFTKAVIENHRKIMETLAPVNEKLGRGNRLFVAGIREMQPDKKFYPNANSTMRLTYGIVKDYFPADAVHYNFYTTLDGVMEKEDPTSDEFNVPAKLKELYKAKNYGRYGENGVMKTCFITNNDITGGNSGSPVLDGSGNLIGLAFDGNWEAMSGNIAFEPELQRTINVDIRYVLFIIDKYAGATNLISEMKLVE